METLFFIYFISVDELSTLVFLGIVLAVFGLLIFQWKADLSFAINSFFFSYSFCVKSLKQIPKVSQCRQFWVPG